MLGRGTFNNNLELPDATVLNAVCKRALDLNETSEKLLAIKNVTTRENSSLRDTIVLDFLAEVETIYTHDKDCYPVSTLMKRSDKSIELQIYSTLFKDIQPNSKLMTVSQQRGVTLYNLIPRPYLIQKPYTFLENLEPIGFRSVDATKLNLDFSHCLLAVETLARFHASSYFHRRQLGLKGTGKLELLLKYPYLNQTVSPVYSPKQNGMKLSSIYENTFELVLKLVESENPSLAFKLRRKVDPATVFDKVVKLLEEEKYDNDDFYVVCHGDYQAGNLLFKYNETGGNLEPKECRITNFHSAVFGPLASDLALFLLTSTTPEFRLEFEEKLLAFYCDAFEEQLMTRYGPNPVPDFDIEEFHRKLEKQYRKMLEFAFYSACVLLPVIVFENDRLSNRNYCPPSVVDLVLETSSIGKMIVDKNLEFEKFVLGSSLLKERFVGILKQFLKYRVLI